MQIENENHIVLYIVILLVGNVRLSHVMSDKVLLGDNCSVS